MGLQRGRICGWWREPQFAPTRRPILAIDSEVLAENAAQLRRLQSLADGLSDADLQRDAGAGWTVAVAFAHLAFWDRLYLGVLSDWTSLGTPQDDPTSNDAVVNDALLGEWLALPPRSATARAVAAAQSVDAAVERLDDSAVDAILSHGQEHLLKRGRHRREHLDQIQRALPGRCATALWGGGCAGGGG